MAMSRKDYEMIAEAISQTREFYEKGIPENYMVSQVLQNASTCARLIANLSNKMRIDNPRFDVDKFLKACGF